MGVKSLTSCILFLERVTEPIHLRTPLGNRQTEIKFGSNLRPNQIFYLRNRLFGKHIGDQPPPVFRFDVFPLREKGFVRIESTIEIIILVPFVLWTVYFIECCRF